MSLQHESPSQCLPPFNACDLCGESTAEVTLRLNGHALLKCNTCGLIRLNPVPTLEELSAVYDTGDYYTTAPARLGTGWGERLRRLILATFWSYPSHKAAMSRALSAMALWPLRDRVMPVPFPGNRPVLDIGCGNGQRLLELESYGCTQLFGVEPTQAAAEQASKATKATIHACLLEEASLPARHFSLIIMNQVLEHVPSPSATLRLVKTLLDADGVLYLTVPNFASLEAGLFGQYWSGLQIPAHLHHFTPGPLSKLLKDVGLRITKLRTDTVQSVTADSILAWKRSNPTRRFPPMVGALPQALYAPITLTADLIGRGQMLRIVAKSA